MADAVRARVAFVAAALLTIALGLVVHLDLRSLPPAARDVLGDALWGAMIAWWIGAVAPNALVWRRGLLAIAICVAVEFSQRVNGAAIDAIRDTTLGHLVLGSDFDARDIVAYAAGVLAAVLLEHVIRRRQSRPSAAD